MTKPTSIERDPLYVVAPPIVTDKTKRFGHIIVWGTFTLMFLLAIIQFLNTNEHITFGFKTWRPVLYAYILWACAIGYSSCLLYTSPSPRDKRQSRMPSSA